VGTFYEKVLGIDEVRFGPRRKLLALIVIAVGMLTFFLPLVTTNPAVLGKTQWSGFDILSHVYQRELLPSRVELVLFPGYFAIVYLLMVFALFVVYFFQSQRALVHIAVVGIILALHSWGWDKGNFEITFYRNYPFNELPPGRHVAFGQLILALIAVMGVLLLIVSSEALDAEPSAKRIQTSEQPRGASTEPEFLEVEILPPEEDGKGKRPGDPRQLHD
jgi:hypothetical protein